MSYRVYEIAHVVGGEVRGDGSLVIREITNVEGAREGSLVLAETPSYFKRVEASPASCILTHQGAPPSRKTLMVVDNPKAAFAKVLALYYPPKAVRRGIHPLTVVGESVRIGADVAIGPFVVIGDRVRIGDRAVIGPCCVIGDDCIVGEGTFLHSHVVLYDGTQVGNRVIIHAGAVLGSDGFGFAPEEGKQIKIPQIGSVVIEDEVEVGANACIDRATLGTTMIRRGTKIDNLVQIGHNVMIGEDCLLSAQVGVAGSTQVGRGCILAGQVGIADHVILEDRVIVGAQSGVAPHKHLKAGEVVWGSPARPVQRTKEQFALMAKLPELFEEMIALRERLADLETRVTP